MNVLHSTKPSLLSREGREYIENVKKYLESLLKMTNSNKNKRY